MTQQSAAGMVASWFESFDRGPEPAAVEALPEIEIGPSEIEVARQEGWNEGFVTAGRTALTLAAQSAAHDAAALMTQLEDLHQQMGGVAESYAAAISEWLVDVLAAMVPSLSRDEMGQRISLTAAVLHQTLQSMTRLEVGIDGGPSVRCQSADEAWLALVRLRDENPDAQAVSIGWGNGKASFDKQRTWAGIQEAITPLATRGSAGVEIASVRLSEKVKHYGG